MTAQAIAASRSNSLRDGSAFGQRHRFSSRVTALTVLTTFTMPAATPKKKNTMTKIGEVPSQRSSR